MTRPPVQGVPDLLIAVRDNRGLETLLEARQAAQEGKMIEAFLQLVQDPDVIENHFIHGFDLPFITARTCKLVIPFRLGRAGDGVPWTVDDGSRTPLWACLGREILDTLNAVRRLHLPSSALKTVARHHGIAPEDRGISKGPRSSAPTATTQSWCGCTCFRTCER